MGKGEEPHQHYFGTRYLEFIQQNESLQEYICYYTDCSQLTMRGLPVPEQLQTLDSKDVRLLNCSTRLEYYSLSDQVQAGIVSGVTDIIEAQVKSSKVITL